MGGSFPPAPRYGVDGTRLDAYPRGAECAGAGDGGPGSCPWTSSWSARARRGCLLGRRSRGAGTGCGSSTTRDPRARTGRRRGSGAGVMQLHHPHALPPRRPSTCCDAEIPEEIDRGCSRRGRRAHRHRRPPPGDADRAPRAAVPADGRRAASCARVAERQPGRDAGPGPGRQQVLAERGRRATGVRVDGDRRSRPTWSLDAHGRARAASDDGLRAPAECGDCGTGLRLAPVPAAPGRRAGAR